MGAIEEQFLPLNVTSDFFREGARIRSISDLDYIHQYCSAYLSDFQLGSFVILFFFSAVVLWINYKKLPYTKDAMDVLSATILIISGANLLLMLSAW